MSTHRSQLLRDGLLGGIAVPATTDARSRANVVAPTIAFARDLLARLGFIPGVQRAALSSIIPFGGRRGANGFEAEGRQAAPGQTLIADQRHVSPGYFTTMNMALVEGRAFQATDDAASRS